MKSLRKALSAGGRSVAAAAGVAVSALAADPTAADEPSKELAEILGRLPGEDYQATAKLCEKLLAGGADTIRQLVAMVGDEFGDPAGAGPKYALHGLANYASRPGADAERKLLAETLAGELAADHSDELKAFLVRQLQLCGRPEEVPALAKLLPSDRLAGPASQALAAIGGGQARKALGDALPKADGSRRVAIRQAVQFLSHK